MHIIYFIVKFTNYIHCNPSVLKVTVKPTPSPTTTTPSRTGPGRPKRMRISAAEPSAAAEVTVSLTQKASEVNLQMNAKKISTHVVFN